MVARHPTRLTPRKTSSTNTGRRPVLRTRPTWLSWNRSFSLLRSQPTLLAPSMANYNFLNCGKGHSEHAKKVKAKKYHANMSQRTHLPLVLPTSNNMFVLTHLTNDGYGLTHHSQP
jgi:hypothetical protein